MRKLLFLFILTCIGGYAYSPYQTTARYTAAVRNREAKTIIELTEFKSFRESLKENLRPIFEELLNRQLPPNMPGPNRQAEVLQRIQILEKSIDLSNAPEAVQSRLDAPASAASVDRFEYTEKGFRSPIKFVVVDTNDERSLWEFRGFSGWRLTRDESSRDVLKSKIERAWRAPR